MDASTALSKLGADILYLNTAFSGTQLGEVCEREKPAAIVYDEEFTELIEKSGIDLPKVIGWHDGEDGRRAPRRGADREGLHRQASRSPSTPPAR